jgi:hypothetical protein
MSLLNIQNRIFGKGDEDDKLVETMFVIMKEFGFTLYDLIGEEIETNTEIKFFKWKILSFKSITKRPGLPNTTFKYLIHFLNKESKLAEKTMKRKK